MKKLVTVIESHKIEKIVDSGKATTVMNNNEWNPFLLKTRGFLENEMEKYCKQNNFTIVPLTMKFDVKTWGIARIPGKTIFNGGKVVFTLEVDIEKQKGVEVPDSIEYRFKLLEK